MPGAAPPAADYAAGLQALADQLHAAGTDAPILVAQGTVCRSPPAQALHQARQHALQRDARLRPGPDTDSLLSPPLRHDGCHLSSAGLDAAATLWARQIMLALPQPSPR